MPAADESFETFLTLVLEHADDELALAHRELLRDDNEEDVVAR